MTTVETDMKKFLGVIIALCICQRSMAADVVVQKVKGDVAVRQGVTEAWVAVRPGELLSPEATIRTGAQATAILLAPQSGEGAAVKPINLPPDVMVDISDLRDLSQEELLLKLTMERVRSTSYQWKNNELNIPRTTVVHGSDKSPSAALAENDTAIGQFLLNGTRVLFENGYFATCALKMVAVMREYPQLGQRFDNRWRSAEALERSNLKGEARSAYAEISRMGGLTQEQQALVRARIEQLKEPH